MNLQRELAVVGYIAIAGMGLVGCRDSLSNIGVEKREEIDKKFKIDIEKHEIFSLESSLNVPQCIVSSDINYSFNKDGGLSRIDGNINEGIYNGNKIYVFFIRDVQEEWGDKRHSLRLQADIDIIDKLNRGPVAVFSDIVKVRPSKINRGERFAEMLTLKSEGPGARLYEFKVSSRVINAELNDDRKEIKGYLYFVGK